MTVQGLTRGPSPATGHPSAVLLHMGCAASLLGPHHFPTGPRWRGSQKRTHFPETGRSGKQGRILKGLRAIREVGKNKKISPRSAKGKGRAHEVILETDRPPFPHPANPCPRLCCRVSCSPLCHPEARFQCKRTSEA